MPYYFGEKRIHVADHSEVAGYFDPRKSVFHDLVQAALDELQPWEKGQDPIHTFDLPRSIGARAVLLYNDEDPLWGVSPHHRAEPNPGVSPYIELEPDDPRLLTSLATLELAGTVAKPILTRIYPGEYLPPLPWMNGAKHALGGVEACLDYWHDNAFIITDRAPELSTQPPDWYEG